MLGKEYTFYLSAIVAILGTVGYHMLMKKIPSTINPLVSIVSIYVAIVILSTLMLPFFLGSGTLLAGLKQMTWLQGGIAFLHLDDGNRLLDDVSQWMGPQHGQYRYRRHYQYCARLHRGISA